MEGGIITGYITGSCLSWTGVHDIDIILKELSDSSVEEAIYQIVYEDDELDF